jgi:hypothetical protein
LYCFFLKAITLPQNVQFIDGAAFSLASNIQGVEKVPGPLRFRYSINLNKQIHLYSEMYSPLFSMIHLSRFIQL